MSRAQLALTMVLVLSLVLQAVLPRLRLLIVLSGAGVSCLASTLFRTGTTPQLLSEVPWDVLVLLIGLGLLSEVLVASRLFGLLAVWSAQSSHANPRRVLVRFAVGMYLVSGLVNNLTALLLVLPVLLILLKLMGVGQRQVTWTLGVLLVACNLGGAATPIGDFPAILLLGRGSMTFASYLVRATPPTAVALFALIGLVLYVVRPQRNLPPEPLGERLSVLVMKRLYRNVRLDLRLLAPVLAILVLMLLAWLFLPVTTGITPELVCWIGVGLGLWVRAALGEQLLRTRVDFEAALFLLSLFLMVGAVRRTGLFTELAVALSHLRVSAWAQLVLFLILSGLTTGLFSAGPSMAALLEVAEVLARRFPPEAVYVGLALSVCAGSSLLLTAATSGPLLQTLTERADLRDREGRPLTFAFFEFLPVGLLSYAVIQLVAIAYIAWASR